ncbi:unannotated protein [freshwater metagenome]|uniref:Unannotated protein n=1 Tax=freshwater metagenome TaxID=449393 RepID=A0A6J7GF95_9ZZZZ
MVVGVLQRQLDRGLHAGGLQRLGRGVGVGAALAVAVHVLQRGRRAGQAVGDVGVQRGVGPAVDLVGDLLAVDQVGHGLPDGEGLGRVGLGGRRAEGLGVEVEDDVADLAAGAVHDLDVVVAAQVVDVGGRQAAEGHVDVALLDVELEVGGVGVVGDVDVLGLRCAEQPLVVGVGGVGDQGVELVVGDDVRAGEGVARDDVVVGGQRVGGEDVLVHDRAGRAGQDLREDLVVGGLEGEHDGGVVGRLDAVHVVEQGRGAVRVVDGDHALEREDDVRGGELVAVGEGQAVLQHHRVLGGRGELGGLGDVGLDVRAAQRGVHQERVDLVHHGERAVVVGTGRVDRGDLVAGADEQRVAVAGAAAPVVVAAAAGGHGQGGQGGGGGREHPSGGSALHAGGPAFSAGVRRTSSLLASPRRDDVPWTGCRDPRSPP